MALLKKKSLPAKTKRTELSKLENKLEHNIKNKAEKLSEDFNKPLSGTGKPVSELKGGAKRNAQFANAGGGSKANGGGGVDEGIKRFMDLSRDIGRKEGLNAAKAISNKNKK